MYFICFTSLIKTDQSLLRKKEMTKEPIVRHRFVRLIIAHLLCSIHMGLSIYVLYIAKVRTLLYLIPVLGTILFGFEATISFAFYRCKEYFRGFSVLIFVYAGTIIATIWVLELQRINQLKEDSWKTVYILFTPPPNHYGGVQGPLMRPQEIFRNFKYLWSQIQIQVFLLLLLTLRALLPKQELISYFGKTDLLFKYFTTGMDSLDFINLLAYPQLYTNSRLVYATLSVWSVSCIQYVVYFPEISHDTKKELHSLLTNSLLITFTMDLPYLIVRLYAIFGGGSHDYTSYFFLFKNILLILLQMTRIRAICAERSQHRKKESTKLIHTPKQTFNNRPKSHHLAAPLSNNNESGARIIFSNYWQDIRKQQAGSDGNLNSRNFTSV